MDKYLEAEKRLAELLGWEDHTALNGVWRTPRFNYVPSYEVPQWCRKWNACGPLMVEHVYRMQIITDVLDPQVTINMHVESINDHPDKDTAVRFAIVQAVITKLEKGKS